MAEDHGDEPPHFPVSEDERKQFARDFAEMRERVPARVIHLDSYARSSIERAVRVLRAYFVSRRSRPPKQGTLYSLMLVGDHADTGRPIARQTRERPDYEIWAFVDHDAYKGLDQHWGKARRMLESEIGHFAGFTLSVFTIGEAARFPLTNRYLAERYEQGLILYDRATDPPRDTRAQSVHDRLIAAVDELPDRTREAFRCYRKRGFDIASIANRLGLRPVEVEMHLAGATGQLIPVLKTDANARTLRPGTGDHPRYNLDLYHRPGDHDRLLAPGLYQYAGEFVDSMMLAADRERPQMTVRQAAYATEFALKAVLLRAGRSDDWNRVHIGLDTGLALREAMACGLAEHPTDTERLIGLLGRYHKDGRTREQGEEVLALMSPARIAETIRALFETVGEMTGYRGLMEDRS